MSTLAGRIAVVTGGTAGVGRGIASELANCGARVFVTGRSIHEGTQNNPQVTGIRCDHREDDQVAAAFGRVAHEAGAIDILVNNVWGGYEQTKTLEFRLSPRVGSDDWAFPSERFTTPLTKDNCWYRGMKSRLQAVGLEWANFQVMRRTHASLSRKAGIDPKVIADQLGHNGLGVNLDVYTKSDMAQRAAAVAQLESEVINA